jgi:hypothetical protein
MNESLLKQIIDAVNHNAELLERHLAGGIYVHRQHEPAKVWVVEHLLGSLRPQIETYDSEGNRIGHGVNRRSQTFNVTEIVFAIPIAGFAILRF